jgi:hypothetical protein
MSDDLFNKRPYDVFVSYSDADADQVRPVVNWLQTAGLKVWWDSRNLLPGDRLAAALPDGLLNARAAVFFVSTNWIDSTWCEDECNVALQQRRADRRYRTIALQLDNCSVPPILANSRVLKMRALDMAVATILLQALASDRAPWAHGKDDIYLSRSWQPLEAEPPNRICSALARDGFRLIGDSPDYASYDGSRRVRRIIESCGALVAVLPYRDKPQHGFTSKFIIDEALLAEDLGRPYMLFAADGVRLEPKLTASAIGSKTFQLPQSDSDIVLPQALNDLKEEYRPSPRMAYSFFTTSLLGNEDDVQEAIALVEQVTCMECLIGRNLEGQHAQTEIVDRIHNSEFVIADVSNDRPNSLIEAGIARGAGVPLHLICKLPESGERHSRFMLRDIETLWYRDAIERVAILHSIARRYRRRVYNSTVAASKEM